MFPQVESESLPSAEKKARLHELERVIEGSIASFLACGRALLQVREEELYRPLYNCFGDYLVKRCGITYSQGASLMRSTQVAEILLANDGALPSDLAESTLRPLQKLPEPLQIACWRLANRITEKPSHHVVSRIVRTVSAAIEQSQSNGSSAPHNEAKRTQKAIFLASIHRLAAGDSFSAQVIALRVQDAAQARRCMHSCKELIARCQAVLRQLQYRFPEL
jgi:hypothetical protein